MKIVNSIPSSTYLTLAILLTLFAACNTNPKIKEQVPIPIANSGDCANSIIVSINKSDLHSDNACKTLLVIAEDHSGSTAPHRRFTREDFRDILTAFNSNTCGEVAVRVIGNTAPGDNDFFRLDFDPPFDELKQTIADPDMNESAALRNKNCSIKKLNDSILANNALKIDAFVALLNEKIVNYKPYRGKDMTNVSNPLHHISDICAEENFKSYRNIVVAILSDGIQSSGEKGKVGLDDKCSGIKLLLVDWANPAVFNNIKNKQTVESKDGVVNFVKSFKCQ